MIKMANLDDLYPEEEEKNRKAKNIYETIENRLIEMVILIRFKTSRIKCKQ